MKTKITLLLAFLFIGLNISFAQQDEECMTKLSIFHEYVKAKNYDAAYQPWMDVRTKCPEFNNAIYVDGEKILKDRVEKFTGADKVAAIKDLVKMWGEREQYFPDKTPKGEYGAQACQLMYDNKGADIRALVVDGQVIGAMKRQGKEGEFRSNLHRGGSANIIKLTDSELRLATNAARVLKLPVCGVDMLQSARGPLLLEVNSTPGLEGIEEATGKNIAKSIITYIEKSRRGLIPTK